MWWTVLRATFHLPRYLVQYVYILYFFPQVSAQCLTTEPLLEIMGHDADGRCALTYYISASDLSRFSEWQLCCLFSAVHLVNERKRSRGVTHTTLSGTHSILTHENCLKHDLCSIVPFSCQSIWLHWHGSSPGSSGAQKVGGSCSPNWNRIFTFCGEVFSIIITMWLWW